MNETSGLEGLKRQQQVLGPGDRAPNFVLPSGDELLWVFYERVRGYRNLLLLCPPGWAGRDAALAALAAAWPRLQALRVDVFAVVAGDVGEVQRLGESLALPFMLFADAERRIVTGYARSFAAEGRPLGLLLDANQRVLEAFDPDLQAPDALALAGFESRPLGGAAGTYDTVAPVLIVPDVLDPATCRGLIARWHEQGHEEGLSQARDAAGRDMRKVERTIKSRRDHVVTDPGLAQQLAQVIGRRIGPELAKIHYLQGFAFDDFVITCYDAARSDHFSPHRDNITAGTQDRLYALTLNLNTGEYEGGGLNFPEYGQTLYAPPAGGAILFSCSLIHEATAPTRGRRFTLLSFLRDPKAKPSDNPLGIWAKK